MVRLGVGCGGVRGGLGLGLSEVSVGLGFNS